MVSVISFTREIAYELWILFSGVVGGISTGEMSRLKYGKQEGRRRDLADRETVVAVARGSSLVRELQGQLSRRRV